MLESRKITHNLGYSTPAIVFIECKDTKVNVVATEMGCEHREADCFETSPIDFTLVNTYESDARAQDTTIYSERKSRKINNCRDEREKETSVNMKRNTLEKEKNERIER